MYFLRYLRFLLFKLLLDKTGELIEQKIAKLAKVIVPKRHGCDKAQPSRGNSLEGGALRRREAREYPGTVATKRNPPGKECGLVGTRPSRESFWRAVRNGGTDTERV